MLDIFQIIEIAKQASLLINKHYNTKFDIMVKQDNSPVTNVDILVDNFISDALSKITKDIIVISEENENSKAHEINLGEYFWLVDPIDGTQGFIEKNGQFTVNISLIKDNQPIIGVIAIPEQETIYFNDFTNTAYKLHQNNISKINCRKIQNNKIDVLMGRSHDNGWQNFEQEYIIQNLTKIGSSIKFCMIAEGLADAYARFGPTMEWDTAAGHAIINAAGGSLVDFNSKSLSYGKPGFKNPSFRVLGNK